MRRMLLIPLAAIIITGCAVEDAIDTEYFEEPMMKRASIADQEVIKAEQLNVLESLPQMEGSDELAAALQNDSACDFAGMDGEQLNLSEVDASCCCGITYYEETTTHSGTCGTCSYWSSSGQLMPGLYHHKYKRMCAICYGCGEWQWQSSSCGPCAG